MYIIKILKFIFKKISAPPPPPPPVKWGIHYKSWEFPGGVPYKFKIMKIPLSNENLGNSIAKRAHLTLESLEIPGRSVIQMRSVIHLSLNRVKF